MTAGDSLLKATAFILIINVGLCVYGTCQQTGLEVCHRCKGDLQNGTVLGHFCTSSSGQILGRCCLLRDNTSDVDFIIGLDLSNCSLNRVDSLQGAYTAVMIDLSRNPIVNLSDSVFQGFIQLDYMNLPLNLLCPGGNSSWEKVEVKDDNRLCQGQKNFCNQTGHMSLNCPENSLCGPFGPGLFECSCAGNFYGYKCLREGEFPVVQVFGPLGVSTVVVSLLLWVTQRRKAKAV